MKEIILDTETTGLSVREGHRIVEIGCIELDNLVPTKNKFHFYLNPERKVSEKALSVHERLKLFLKLFSQDLNKNEICFLSELNYPTLCIQSQLFYALL